MTGLGRVATGADKLAWFDHFESVDDKNCPPPDRPFVEHTGRFFAGQTKRVTLLSTLVPATVGNHEQEPGPVPRGAGGGGGIVITTRYFCALAIVIAIIGGTNALADDKGIDQSSCQDAVNFGWPSLQRGDSTTDAAIARINAASVSAWPLKLDDHRWIPMPNGKITKVAAREKRGRLEYMFIMQADSNAVISLSWMQNTSVGSAFPPNKRSDLPADTAELVRRGIQLVGMIPNCLEMTDQAVAQAFAAMGDVQAVLTDFGSSIIYSLNKDIVLAEETQPRNSDLEKHWESAYLPQSGADDILQVHWMFRKDATTTIKDVPLTMFVQPDRLTKAPPWATQLADAVRTRDANKLRNVADQAGWQLFFPFARKEPQLSTP